VKEYDIYVPLTYNDGQPIERRKLVRLRERLLAQFGGLTFFPQHNDGFWTLRQGAENKLPVKPTFPSQ
jgi:hypothetical protein